MKRPFTRSRGLLLILISAALSLTAIIWGCSGSGENPVAPAVSDNNAFTMANPRIRTVADIQERHTPSLMADPDVLGTGITLDDNGQPAIGILVISDRAANAVPKTLEGVAVKTIYTDKIVAMKGGPGGGGGVNHKTIQTPPIELGTSGGWRYDLANGYCCGGTLGSLVQRGGNQFVLSNYHVLEADIVNGGNGRTADAGDPVIQPALIDVGCNANNAQNVATLEGTHSLPGSNVDAAIAQVVPGMVRTDGSILEVGTISSSTVAASVGQDVKKSGRTTGLSRASVSMLNATVTVGYENECAGGAAFNKTFNGQIITTNKGSKFLAGGDSGSLMVEDVTTNPRAVGLLFAGSSTLAVANPIGQVLSFFNASMVGN